MAAERPLPRPVPRVPATLTLPALFAHAAATWRLRRTLAEDEGPASGQPAEEYRSVCEFMRLYATLRIYQLALLLGTTGSVVTALVSGWMRIDPLRSSLLRGGALVVTLALLVMEVRATSHWQRLRRRADTLAQALQFQPFLQGSRWNPLTTSGAGFYLHLFIALMWLASLLLMAPESSN